ncbi:hypothetical protein [Streptomyces hoynatensis]|nr:hypothetical protein [Streptomyces hoynatensis]
MSESEAPEPTQEELDAGQAEVEEADVEGHSISEELEVDAPVLDVNFGC